MAAQMCNILLVYIIFISQTMALTMTPVITNSTGEYYIVSKTGNFSNSIIQCNTNNCHIICDLYYGCEKTSVYASNSQSLEITCTAELACRFMQLLSEPSFELTVNCLEISSCEMFSILSQSNLQGETTVNCLNQWACSSMNLECSDNGNCNINCQTSHLYPCDRLEIFISNEFYDGLNLLSDTSISYTLICTDYMVFDGYYETEINNVDECSNYNCCPFFTNTIRVPSGAMNVNCAIDNCSGAQIDATRAHSFNIDCREGTCNYSKILTPLNSITDTFTLDCGNTSTCDYTRIISKNAGVVYINCYEKSCFKTSIYAEYAHEVHITCHGIKSCYDADFFVNNSKNVTFTARGDIGYPVASNANSVMITCTTGYEWDHACVTMNWYIPNNAIINCYGYGCGDDYTIFWNDMYVENASDIQMNINGCDVCNSINECIESHWSINCLNGNDYEYGVEKLYTSCGRNRKYNCGCNSLVQNRKWFNKPSNPLCYAPYDDYEDAASVVVVTIIIVVIVLVLVIIIIGLLYYKKNYVRTKQDTCAVSVNDPNETAEKLSINEENNNINIVPSAPELVEEIVVPSAPIHPPGYNDVNGTFEDGKMGENEGLIEFEGNEGNKINFDLNEWFRNDVELLEYNTMYIDLFVVNGFDNIKALKEMTDEDLSIIGINKLGHRKVILSAIRNIQ
eukprot:152155_1